MQKKRYHFKKAAPYRIFNPVVPFLRAENVLILRTFCPFFVFLYVKYLCLPERRFVIGYIYKKGDCDCRYEQYRNNERMTKETLIDFEQKYTGVTNTDNVNDIIRNLKKRKKQER